VKRKVEINRKVEALGRESGFILRGRCRAERKETIFAITLLGGGSEILRMVGKKQSREEGRRRNDVGTRPGSKGGHSGLRRITTKKHPP